jgi:hypothetical protein
MEKAIEDREAHRVRDREGDREEDGEKEKEEKQTSTRKTSNASPLTLGRGCRADP